MERIAPFLKLAAVRQDFLRNIVSAARPEALFSDLSDAPAEWAFAQKVARGAGSATAQGSPESGHWPAAPAAWKSAIGWPFRYLRGSRFSDGAFGVWYGADSVETSVHEAAYHWYHGLLKDAGFERSNVVAKREVYAVHCHALLLDFRRATAKMPALLHSEDYSVPRQVGARLQREGHPGLLIQSVRRRGGACVAVFNAAVLASPRLCTRLVFRLEDGKLTVEKENGVQWMTLGRKNL